MENKKLYKLIQESVNNDMNSTYEIITEFRNIIESESYINGKFNQECYDYIIEQLQEKIKKFKNY